MFDPELERQLRRRREDREFAERLRRRIAEDQELLRRLEGNDLGARPLRDRIRQPGIRFGQAPPPTFT